MNIPYRISQIKTIQFAYFTEKLNYELYKQEKSFGIDVSFNFSYNESLTNIRCNSHFNYSQHDNLFLVCEVESTFDISPQGKENIIQEKKIPLDFLHYMATIVTGTARGVIHAKTEGTILNEFVLPPINVVEAINKPLVINIEEITPL